MYVLLFLIYTYGLGAPSLALLSDWLNWPIIKHYNYLLCWAIVLVRYRPVKSYTGKFAKLLAHTMMCYDYLTLEVGLISNQLYFCVPYSGPWSSLPTKLAIIYRHVVGLQVYSMWNPSIYQFYFTESSYTMLTVLGLYQTWAVGLLSMPVLWVFSKSVGPLYVVIPVGAFNLSNLFIIYWWLSIAYMIKFYAHIF